MSIASELEALADNLAGAKNAVEAKGGTVGDTGLAGLASEITTIPTGGTANWGTVTYLNSGTPKTVTIQSIDEYVQLGQTNVSKSITIGGDTFTYDTIRAVALGSSATFAPDNFLRGFTGGTLQTGDVTLTGTENLLVIENNFLYQSTAINNALDLSNVVEIGSDFMTQCTTFNSNITLSKVIRIGKNFMYTCSAFSKTITLPATLSSTDDYMFYCCDNMTSLVCNGPASNSGIKSSNNMLATTNASAPMYTTGITLTGTEAERWKNRLADRSSSPYRKLILGA